MIREAKPDEKIEKAEFVYRSTFMAMEHNYLCAVCREQSAVIDGNTGILHPCWACQKLGYKIIKTNWINRFLGQF